MQEIINILMKRDGLTESEARELIEETKDMMEECEYEPEECEDIFMRELGLEPDYLPMLLLEF